MVTMPSTKVAAGTQLKRWTVGKKLGEGAFGAVYLGSCLCAGLRVSVNTVLTPGVLP